MAEPVSIDVGLTGLVVNISDLQCEVCHGPHQITWRLPPSSGKLKFAPHPLTFYGELPPPFTPFAITPRSVTYTDNNENNSGKPIDYKYQLHLVFEDLLLTYPASPSFQRADDPCIRNRPK